MSLEVLLFCMLAALKAEQGSGPVRDAACVEAV